MSWITVIAQAQTTKQMWVGESFKCDATSAIFGLTSDISWTTSGGYFSLSGSGLYRDVTITQYFSGQASVTCSWKYRLYSGDTWKEQSKTWTFTCQENPVSISPSVMTLSIGESGYVGYNHKYNNNYTYAANVYFSSSNSSIVSVSNTGEITAKSPGTAYITVYSKLSSAANAPYCTVIVKEAEKPTSISLPDSEELAIGKSKKLNPEIIPTNATATLSWSSDNETIATVSSQGVVTGIALGTAKITVTTNNGLSGTCTVTVKEKDRESQIKLTKAVMKSLRKKVSDCYGNIISE